MRKLLIILLFFVSACSIRRDTNNLQLESCKYGALMTALYYMKTYKISSPGEGFEEGICEEMMDINK